MSLAKYLSALGLAPAGLAAAVWGITPAAIAQTTLTPTPGVTETVVTPAASGSQYDITGGAVSSGENPNLFHHFLQFDLGTGDTANFVVPADIANVINLINSSNPSLIDGTLTLTGASANLYLVSPAGVIFGPGAQLALPANLTATTADGLLFDEALLLVEVTAASESSEATAAPDPAASPALDVADLSGAPTAYVFTSLEPGAVENQGSLAIAPGQTLLLVGGTVQNRGTITAPSGTVDLVAVPGGYTVRLSRPGDLLSLELTPNADDLPEFSPSPIVPGLNGISLPVLLTGGSATSADQVVTAPDGTMTLTQAASADLSSNLEEVGTVLVRGDIDVSGETGGSIALVGPRVVLIDAQLIADGITAGGTVQIGSLPAETLLDETLTPTPAATAYIYSDRNTQASASGLAADSAGGLIYIWSSASTRYRGSATAAGEGGTVVIDGVERRPAAAVEIRPAPVPAVPLRLPPR